jgi:hypothetical protein
MGRSRLATALLCSACFGIGCSGEGFQDGDKPVLRDPDAPLSWEEFREIAEKNSRMVNGERVYIVEWDIPLDEAKLFEYYASRYLEREKSTVDVLNSNGMDNVWPQPQQLALSYCVSVDFGSDHARMKEEMNRAALAWTNAANVNFIYKPLEDTNCVDANAAVTVPVVPFSEGGACAFFPDDNGAVHCTSAGRALVINVASIDAWHTGAPIFGKSNSSSAPGNEVYSNITTEGVLRHELGHILGLRHEQIREADNAIPFTTCSWEVPNPGPNRALTAYDVNSVMHYPWCDGVLTSALIVTPLDAQGAARLYGPPAWYAALDLD